MVRETVLRLLNEALATELVCALRYKRQLGGEPDFDPGGLSARSHAAYFAGKTLVEMLEADRDSGRFAIELEEMIIRFVGEHDSTTRRLMEGILAQDEKHADELDDFLRQIRVGRSA